MIIEEKFKQFLKIFDANIKLNLNEKKNDENPMRKHKKQ